MSLTVRLEKNLALSLSFQKRLEKIWGERFQDPKAYTPYEMRELVTAHESYEANRNFGLFASEYLKSAALHDSTGAFDRLMRGKRLVSVGYGKGFDSDFLGRATVCGFKTTWIDVCPRSIAHAEVNINQKWEELGANDSHLPKPEAVQGEIRSILAEPQSIGLDLGSVEVWFVSRTLGCLSSWKSIRVVLQLMAESLQERHDREKSHKIVIVATLRDYNKSRVGKTNKMPTMRQILSNIHRGAGRPVQVHNEAAYRYYDQVVTAMTIAAK